MRSVVFLHSSVRAAVLLSLVSASAGRAEDSVTPREASPSTDGAPAAGVETESAPVSTTSATDAPVASAPVEAKGLDARIRRLSDGLAREIKRMPGDWRDATFAVVRFVDVGEEVKTRQLGLVVSDLVITNLVRDHRVAITERSAIEQVLNEAALGQLGITEGADATRVGKIAGARGLILGEVSDIGDSYRVSARLVDVESGQARGAFDASVPKDELIALSQNAVVLRSKSGAFFRSLVAPGWGQTYNDDSTTALIVAGTVGTLAVVTVGFLASGLVTHVLYATWSADNIPPGSTLTKEQEIEQLQGLLRAAGVLYTLAGVTGALTGVVWLSGALEAYISGVDIDSLDRARLAE
jgi:TolB-like protein